jgi:hypothetical protein
MGKVDSVARVRDLCRQISQENDPGRVRGLLSDLREAVEAGQEDARVRIAYIARHYRGSLISGQQKESGQRAGMESTQRIRAKAILRFLGLGSGMPASSKASNAKD